MRLAKALHNATRLAMVVAGHGRNLGLPARETIIVMAGERKLQIEADFASSR
jgi:hypothetical protein